MVNFILTASGIILQQTFFSPVLAEKMESPLAKLGWNPYIVARIELLKCSVGGIITGSTRENVTKESVPHPPAKCQLVHHNRPFHIPVMLPTGCSYYPNVATDQIL